jgi:Ammonium Transporter Family
VKEEARESAVSAYLSLLWHTDAGFSLLCVVILILTPCFICSPFAFSILGESDSCGGGLAFWAVGYAFAYGGDDDGPKTFVGNKGFFLQGDDNIRFENWFFQFAFACALSSIVAGTIAERTQMKAYLLYSVFLSGFVYPVVRTCPRD